MNRVRPSLSTLGLETSAVRTTLFTAAKAAARITLPVFRKGGEVHNKLEHGFDPVTSADRDAEVAIRDVISSQFPEHAIIGEEHADKVTQSPFTWIIDPIDGTRAYISGLPVWGTLIALAHEGKTIAGLMDQPFTGETFVGLEGTAFHIREGEETQLSVSKVQNLDQAILFSTAPGLFSGQQQTAFAHLQKNVRLTRFGCDCYAYCLLAGGHIDLVVEPKLNIYDIAALIPIIEFAGGIVTNFDGEPAHAGGDIIAAATPQIHQAAMDIMKT